MPAVLCRPQQISAVLASLLRNAVQAVDGTGRVELSTSRENNSVAIRISDNGRGLSPDQVANIFDPGIRESGGRMAAGNWSMFNSRQIVREHGGDIAIASHQGRGTVVTVMLPLSESDKSSAA